MTTTVADLVDALEAAYPPALAEPWDTGIGLTCGDRDAEVRSVLLAVDVDDSTVAEASQTGAQLLVTHHPLLFRPVQSVAVDTDKGRLLQPLIRDSIAHFAAHTNADRAVGGVNDALADALGLADVRPLVPVTPEAWHKLVVFVPRAAADPMIAALSAAGAGRMGNYDAAAFVSEGIGRFRPLPGARPAIGRVGETERVAEARIEMVVPPSRRAAVVDALRRAHPYEEPAFDIYTMPATTQPTEGLGRVGTLERPLTLRQFAQRVADALPATAAGVRTAGDPDRMIGTVAVCGGAGGGELPAATASGADAYVTSDLSHHIAGEHIAVPTRPALVEVAHWAGEWPWLAHAADVIRSATDGSVAVTVSTRRTDPWTMHTVSDSTEGVLPRAER